MEAPNIKRRIVKIFRNPELTQEITDDDIYLGDISAGHTKIFKFWLKNDSKAHLSHLKFIINHDEAKVTLAPENMLPYATSELIIECTPKVTIEEPILVPIGIKAIVRFKAK